MVFISLLFIYIDYCPPPIRMYLVSSLLYPYSPQYPADSI